MGIIIDEKLLYLLNKTIVMSTLEMRKEMLELIQNEDETSLQRLYKMFKEYKQQIQANKDIAEAEEDIKADRVCSIEVVKDFIDDWKIS